jgi:hypothetical protein
MILTNTSIFSFISLLFKAINPLKNSSKFKELFPIILKALNIFLANFSP